MPRAIRTDLAPAAIGPYSQAVLHDDLLWCSGALGIDPTGGELEDGVQAQTRRALDNLDAVCRAAGTALERAIRCTVYLTDLADFARVNEIYGERFADPPPARACVQVAALPKGAAVEIDAVVAAETER